MIAAVNPTGASRRSGTPGPRSDSASSPSAALLTIGATVLEEVDSVRFAHADVRRQIRPRRPDVRTAGGYNGSALQRLGVRRAFRPRAALCAAAQDPAAEGARDRSAVG